MHSANRLYTARPRNAERFYLRTFLLYAQGAEKFAEIRIVNCVEYRSFRKARITRGILANGVECVQEHASAFRSSSAQLTHVSGTALGSCEPRGT